MSLKKFIGVAGIVLVLGIGPATQAWHQTPTEQVESGPISVREFSRIITEFSEEDGYFRSDNLVSNETSYLHVLSKMRSLGCTGGAYVGVGPEQNFTYIANIHPRIVFIVDIRRQAMLQHLMYKAIFREAKTRAQFLSYLLSKPIGDEAKLRADAPIEKLLDYFTKAPTDNFAFARNLQWISKTIRQDFEIPLSDRDYSSLESVYAAFRDDALDIQYQSGGPYWPGSNWSTFPTMRELILEQDLKGHQANFLVNRSDYEFVRSLEQDNRIIPVVGDFAGRKALASVGEYLQKNGYWVSAFYTSNVEQYLFSNGVFDGFAENVRKLPITDRSLFIRSFPNARQQHPAEIAGDRLTPLLQKISIFLDDYNEGLYEDYWSLVTTHFIAGSAE